jgi:hypothetical protein
MDDYSSQRRKSSNQLVGIGLVIHIVLDAIDCWWMHHR